MNPMVERVRDALLAEKQRQFLDPTTTSAFLLMDRYGNNTPLDFTGLAEAAVRVIVEEVGQ